KGSNQKFRRKAPFGTARAKVAKETSMEPKKPTRRKFLRGTAEAAMAGLAVSARPAAAAAQTGPPDAAARQRLKDEVAYGERSHFVTSLRVPVVERTSPDEFGLTYHVLSPLQDSVGIIT